MLGVSRPSAIGEVEMEGQTGFSFEESLLKIRYYLMGAKNFENRRIKV